MKSSTHVCTVACFALSVGKTAGALAEAGASGPFDLRLKFREGQTQSWLIVRRTARWQLPEFSEYDILRISCVSVKAAGKQKLYVFDMFDFYLDRKEPEHVGPESQHKYMLDDTGFFHMDHQGKRRKFGKGALLAVTPDAMNRGRAFPTLPSRPVSVGESWEETYQFTNQWPPHPKSCAELKVTYKLREIQRRFVAARSHRRLTPLTVVEYTGNGEVTITSTYKRDRPRDVRTAVTVSGRMFFSMKIGQMVKVDQRISIEVSENGKKVRSSELRLEKILISNPHIKIVEEATR